MGALKQLPPPDSDKIRVNAEFISQSASSYYLKIDGDNHWIPKSLCTFHEEHKAVDIVEWKYKKMFE